MLFEGELPGKVSGQYAQDLDALANILDIWLFRDIRFIALPRALSDAKKRRLSKKVVRKIASIERISDFINVSNSKTGAMSRTASRMSPTGPMRHNLTSKFHLSLTPSLKVQTASWYYRLSRMV